MRLVAARFSGPLPPPETLRDYERVLPGSAERILSMAEKELIHRRAVESRYSETVFGNSRIGVVFGFLIGTGGLIAATVIAIFGDPEAGVGMGLVTLGSLVGVFVYGTRVRFTRRTVKYDRF